MSDKVQTQEEAVALAIAFLKDLQDQNKQSYIERYKDNPEKLKHVDKIFVDWSYNLLRVTITQEGWLLTFMMEHPGVSVDEGINIVQLNRITGEAEYVRYR